MCEIVVVGMIFLVFNNFLSPGDSSTPFKPGIFFFIVNAP